jgi:hypothetical protein
MFYITNVFLINKQAYPIKTGYLVNEMKIMEKGERLIHAAVVNLYRSNENYPG